MRFPARRFPAPAAFLTLLALSGCFWEDNPFLSGGGGIEGVFGSSAIAWWAADSAGGGAMDPVLNGSHVYFERDIARLGGTLEAPSHLVALDRGSGAEMWAAPMTAAHNAAVAGGRVAAVWGSLVIVDPVTGARRHQYIPAGQTTLNTNVATDGTRFYAATHDGRAVAIDPATGGTVWETDLSRGGEVSAFGVSVSGETVAVAFKHFAWTLPDRDSGFVAALDRATGAVRWRARVEGAADPGTVEPPAIVGGLVVAVTQGHDVRAWDLQTGALRWQVDASFAAPEREYGSRGFASCDGLVMVPTGDLGLAALDAANGAVRWRLRNLGEGSLFGVHCAHGTVTTLGAGLRVFDARTGGHRATYPRREPDTSDDGREFWINSVVRDERYLYVGTTWGFGKIRAP